eukprot:TRINITY_DN7217_c0_g1_i1.p1 TRINITY_DN7217_c0_g1~~TRINITY_DN7217_c0_g1_i1.p1  ORF type:complete len:190 (-),score=29.09 TRINITY_DN7217_c0_g1_i1:133-702(-)
MDDELREVKSLLEASGGGLSTDDFVYQSDPPFQALSYHVHIVFLSPAKDHDHTIMWASLQDLRDEFIQTFELKPADWDEAEAQPEVEFGAYWTAHSAQLDRMVEEGTWEPSGAPFLSADFSFHLPLRTWWMDPPSIETPVVTAAAWWMHRRNCATNVGAAHELQHGPGWDVLVHPNTCLLYTSPSPRDS